MECWHHFNGRFKNNEEKWVKYITIITQLLVNYEIYIPYELVVRILLLFSIFQLIQYMFQSIIRKSFTHWSLNSLNNGFRTFIEGPTRHIPDQPPRNLLWQCFEAVPFAFGCRFEGGGRRRARARARLIRDGVHGGGTHAEAHTDIYVHVHV